MRHLLFIFFFVFIFLSWNSTAYNPLKNTQWSGTVNVPDANNGTFIFTADTSTLYVGGSAIETMVYKVNGDTLKLVKLSGMSPCNTSDTGYFKYNIKDSVLTITVLQDVCSDRSNAFTAEGYRPTHTSF